MQIQVAQKHLLDALIGYDPLEARSIARIVLKDVFQTEVSSTKALSDENGKLLLELCKRLANSEPVQYVTGWANFYGAMFRVTPDVLIPRHDTETLVRTCLETLKEDRIQNPEILDIGTGSGCIAITFAKQNRSAKVKAIDISPAALLVAEANASLNNVQVGFISHDVLTPGVLPVQGFDLIVSNPPYIPSSEQVLMHKNVLDFEPHMALFVEDTDPLLFYRTIIEKAKDHLYENGLLAFECNEFNADKVRDLMVQNGFRQCKLVKDLAGADRVIIGKMPLSE